MVKIGDDTLTITRRTVLSKAKYDAMLFQASQTYEALANEFDETPEVMDYALTLFCRLSAQTTAPNGFPLARATDTNEEFIEKARAYLALNPDDVDRWQDEMRDQNRAWNVPVEKKEPSPKPSGSGGDTNSTTKKPKS